MEMESLMERLWTLYGFKNKFTQHSKLLHAVFHSISSGAQSTSRKMILTHRSSTLFLILLQVIVITVASRFRNELPIAKIIEIRTASGTKLETGEEERLIEKPPNSDIVVGEDVQADSKLIFECDARYPIQWVYNGNGMPEYSTNTTQIQNAEGITRPDNLFLATISLGYRRNISYHDSGRYTCRSLQNPDLSVYYNLYAPDGILFMNPDGNIIYFSKTDTTIRIPCSVSNPKIAVSLQKSINGLVQCPLNDSITYDSTKGFDLRISKIFNPAGTYVCTAGFNDTYQVVRYTLIRDDESEPSPITSEGKNCTRNSDCPPVQSCMQSSNNGHRCASPCGSVCGRNTQCDVMNHIPRCYCLSGHVGDPYHACQPIPPSKLEINNGRDPCVPTPCGTNAVCERHGTTSRCFCAPGFYYGDPYVRCHRFQPQQRDPCSPNPCGTNSVCNHRNGFTSCSCSPGHYGQPPYCRPECEVHYHCPSDRACVSGRCRNPCEGACVSFKRTECRVINHQAVCATINCPSGYYGRDCLSVYTKEDGQIKIPLRRVGGSSIVPLNDEATASPCSPSPCGIQAECAVKTVENSNLNVTSEIALCTCPSNLTGNADVECYPVDEQIQTSTVSSPSERSGLSEETLEKSGDDMASVTSTSLPPLTVNASDAQECDPECGINANCTGNNICSCPDKYEGNPMIKCYPTVCSQTSDCDNVNSSCILGRCVDSNVKEKESRCGNNAIYVMVTDMNSTCECPTNYTGDPTVSCHPIIINATDNDKSPSSIVGQQASTSSNSNLVIPKPMETCEKKCGINTRCILQQTSESNVIVTQVICECLNLFRGNPVVGCEMPCGNNSDCPLHQLCDKMSHRCVNPCDPEHQPFYTQCIPQMNCKVENHESKCLCPEASANNDCKNVLQTSPPVAAANHTVNVTCEKRLKCGHNAACKRFHDLERCVCMPGFFGDPTVDQGCKLGIQCRENEHCSEDEECGNGKCLKVCRDGTTCGNLASCKAVKHKRSYVCDARSFLNEKGQCELTIKGEVIEGNT